MVSVKIFYPREKYFQARQAAPGAGGAGAAGLGAEPHLLPRDEAAVARPPALIVAAVRNT